MGSKFRPSSERSRVTSPENTITISRSTWTTNPNTLSISPIVSAWAAGAPCRWKKRTFTATRAAELGTASAMNWIAYSSAITGPSRSGRVVAPSVPNDCATGTSGTMTRPAHNQAVSAFLSSSTTWSIPTLAIAVKTKYAASSRRAIVSTEPIVTRRSGSIFGRLGPRLGRRPVPDRVQVVPRVLQRPSRGTAEGRGLDVREDLGQPVGTDGRPAPPAPTGRRR